MAPVDRGHPATVSEVPTVPGGRPLRTRSLGAPVSATGLPEFTCPSEGKP